MSNSANTAVSTDRIVKEITLDAPRARVWRALTDVKQFATWFGVAFDTPFTQGAEVSGKIASPKYAHITSRIWIETLEPERLFSFRWHPHALDPDKDYSSEPKTLVTFTLDEVASGTHLTIVESGFDALKDSERRVTAFTGNSKGWESQMENIRKFVTA